MGFFVRKATSVGPFRVNLSKGGLGTSLGVKGARISSGPSGAHVFAGRKGMYYRKSLNSSRAATRQEITSKANPPVVDGGMYFIIYLFFACVGGLVYLYLKTSRYPLLSYVFLALVVTGFVLYFLKKISNRKAILSYAESLNTLCSNFISEPSANNIESCNKNAIKLPKSSNYKQRIVKLKKDSYRKIINMLAQEDEISSDASENLLLTENLLQLPNDFYLTLKKQVLNSFYLGAISDSEISTEEERIIENIIERLSIPRKSISKELRIIDDIKIAQKLALPLKPSEEPSPVKLARKESLYLLTNGKVYTRKKAKTDPSGFEYTQKRNGTLLVTSKRLMVIDKGTTTVKFTELADTEVDLDRSVLLISKSTSERPIVIGYDSPVFLGRLINLVIES